jgi:hypothetical protein
MPECESEEPWEYTLYIPNDCVPSRSVAVLSA